MLCAQYSVFAIGAHVVTTPSWQADRLNVCLLAHGYARSRSGLVLVLTTSPSAPAQEPARTPSPQELWNAYPLQPDETTPLAVPTTPPADAIPPRPRVRTVSAESDDGGGVPVLPIALARRARVRRRPGGRPRAPRAGCAVARAGGVATAGRARPAAGGGAAAGACTGRRSRHRAPPAGGRAQVRAAQVSGAAPPGAAAPAGARRGAGPTRKWRMDMNGITRAGGTGGGALALAGIAVGGIVLGEHAEPADSRPPPSRTPRS